MPATEGGIVGMGAAAGTASLSCLTGSSESSPKSAGTTTVSASAAWRFTISRNRPNTSGRSRTRAIWTARISVGLVRSRSISAIERLPAVHCAPQDSSASATNAVLKSRNPAKFSILILCPRSSSAERQVLKSDDVSHVGLSVPIGVKWRWLRSISPRTVTPHCASVSRAMCA